jgi:hypothetical protein
MINQELLRLMNQAEDENLHEISNLIPSSEAMKTAVEA